jgi:Kef-type K+ transport system membrane component KefB
MLHSRICAAVTAASCLGHLWLAVGNHHPLWLNVAMVAMVAVCLPCSLHIWRHGRVRALHRVIGCALAMAVLHALLVLGAGPSGHAHAASAGAGAGTSTSAAAVSLAVIAVEITTALLAATLVARLRARDDTASVLR